MDARGGQPGRTRLACLSSAARPGSGSGGQSKSAWSVFGPRLAPSLFPTWRWWWCGPRGLPSWAMLGWRRRGELRRADGLRVWSAIRATLRGTRSEVRCWRSR
eukprot:11541805-Heterocapsa_arctica.AAC.1